MSDYPKQELPNQYIKMRDMNGKELNVEVTEITHHKDGYLYFSTKDDEHGVRHFRMQSKDAVQEIID